MILIGNQFDDYGVGWSDTYNVKVYDSGGVTDTKYLILENGAAIPFSASAAPSTANPVVPCTLPPGANFLAEWDFEAASGAHLFKFTYPDRTQWTFSTVLKNRYQPVYSLSSITDRNGHSIYFRYDMGYGPPEVPTDNVYLALSAYLLLTRITDDSGNPLLTINRAQDGSGLIKSISDRYGRTVVYQSSSHPTAGVPQSWPQYHYDLDVVSQIVPTGTLAPPMRMQYGYANYPDLEGTELTPFLHTITFPSPTGKGASTETINYSTANLAVTSTVDANGVVHKYSSVDGNHVKVTITDSKGNLAYSYTVGFDNNMSQTTRTDGTNTTVVDSRTLSDPNNPYKPSTVTDGNGNITAYSWDQFGNLQSRTSPYGTRTTLTWSYTRFALGELSRIQEGSKTPLTLGYHEPSGLLATLTAPQPGTVGDGKTVVTSITYDSLGNPLTIVQPGNNATATRTTTFNYQTDGAYSQTAAYGQPIVITDNLGHSTHYRYDPRAEMISVTDALGNQTNLGYNLAGQILQIAYPALSDVTASVAVSRSALTYSGATQTYSGSLTLTNAGHATFTGRIAAVLTNLTPGITLVNPYGSYEGNPYLLSAAGTLAPKQSVTLPITLSNPKSLAVSYGVQAYLTDAHGAPASMNARVAAGYLYPGGPLLQAALYDEAGSVLRSVSRAYGPEGETLSVTGSANSLGVRYDGDYRVTTILDGNGHATHYSYNTAGYLHDVTYPLGDLVRYPKYDRNGNVLQRIDGRGIETDYVYNDPASRLTDVQYHSTGKYTGLEALDVHVSYDEYSRVIGFTDGSGSTARAYDDLNKLLSVTTTYTGPNGKALPAVTIDYGFYPDGSRASMDITSGTAKYPFSYGFDKVSRLVSLVNPGGTTEQWSYFDNGWVKSRQTAQGAAGLYSYNARGFLNDLTYYAPDGSLLADFGEMTYDASGSRLTLSALNPARPAYSGFTGYTYDSKNQLTLEQSTRNGGYTNSFAYDLAGNATQFRGNARTYNTENQRTGSGFAYDGNGNPTSYAYTSLAFDPENHMTSFGSALTAGYRADGLRAWKRSASGQTYFVYSGIVPVCEMDSTGNVTAVNTFGRDGLVSRDTAAGEQVYAFDPQGSAALALSTSGAVQASMMLDAFGAGAGQSTPYGGFGSRWGYYSDAETSVPLLGLRHYDPAIGRFMTRDPIGANGGVNFYRYVSNDAPNLADPLGLCAKSGSQQPPWDGSNPWNWPPDLWPGSSGPPLPPNPIGGGPLAPWPDNNGNTGPPMSGEPALIIAEAGAMHAGFELAEALSPNPVLEWLGTSALLYDAYRLFSEPRPSPSDDDGQHTGTAGPGNLPLPPPTIFGSPWPP
jgi:RHS repeat-associated protein